MTTFSDLGIPFPLFEAPTTEATDFTGLATCRLCGGRDRQCFELRSRDALILSCPACGGENGLDADSQSDIRCRSCEALVSLPELLKTKKQLLVCYACLQAGNAAMTKDTEFGMVSWEQAFRGVTHGLPGLQTDQFERVLVSPEEDWYGARIPAEHLWELLRTPSFHSWQGERWLFCC
ncbi:MAG: CbrC family protein, partial [Isosphaeraceae bacterium]